MSNGDFRRALGPWSATALVAGSMIGTGIFFFVSDVAVRLTSPGAILAAWTVGAVVASCGALSLAELAAAYPETGGIYVFLRRGYGPLVGFLYSWAKFLIMRPGSLAILAVAFAGFSIDLLGMDRESAARAAKPVAIAAVLVLSAVNMIGVRAGARVQDVLTAIKILCLLGLIGVGAAFAVGWLQSHAVSVEPAPARAGPWLVSLGAALIPILWTFGGWDESPFVAEEVRNPGRDLPLSILAGLWTVALLYIAANAAYLAILSPAEIAGTAGRTATVAMERALGPGARRVLAIALMLSTLGAANGLVLTGGRIPYAAGRDLALFRWFARTAPRARIASIAAWSSIRRAISVLIGDSLATARSASIGLNALNCLPPTSASTLSTSCSARAA